MHKITYKIAEYIAWQVKTWYTIIRKSEVILWIIPFKPSMEQFIRVQLNELPIGYISKKTIKGNPQYYLQRRVGEKMTGVYIRADEVQNVREALERRAQYESEKKQIAARLEQLEADWSGASLPFHGDEAQHRHGRIAAGASKAMYLFRLRNERDRGCYGQRRNCRRNTAVAPRRKSLSNGV